MHLRDQTDIKIGSDRSRLSFSTEGGGQHAIWDRYLCIDGAKAYHIGNVCNTCAFFFQRMDGATKAADLEQAAQALKSGIETVFDPVVASIGMGLPLDEYVVCLFEAGLSHVAPGQSNDFFVKEQPELYSVYGISDPPNDPRIAYYRAGDTAVEGKARLYHLVVPMFPEGSLKGDVITAYTRSFEEGGTPTAVCLSVLDVKGPQLFEGDDPDPDEHWVFAHYVIDGHHKLAAASRSGHIVRMLCFISLTKGVSTVEQVRKAISVCSPPGA